MDVNLDTLRKIDLSWHVVCGRYEMEEFQLYGVVRPWRYRDPRHEIFDKLKYTNQSKWQGDWGPEPLLYDNVDDLLLGQLGRVWCTERRAEEIKHWIINTIHNVAPGND